MDFLLRIAGFALLSYVVVVGAMYIVQRQLQYFPDRMMYSPVAAGVPEMSIVGLTAADGVEIIAWYTAAANGLPTIVYFHGNAGSIADRSARVRPWLEAGFGVLLLSYRGFGGSDGRPTESGLYSDARAAIAYVLAQGVPIGRVALYWESLGTGVAVKMAGEHEVGALVLEAPFTSAADVGAGAYPILPVRWMLKDRFDSISRIADVKAPLLIFHGEADRTIPVTHGRKLFADAPNPKEAVFIPGAGHNDLRAFGASELVMTFLTKTFAGVTN